MGAEEYTKGQAVGELNLRAAWPPQVVPPHCLPVPLWTCIYSMEGGGCDLAGPFHSSAHSSLGSLSWAHQSLPGAGLTRWGRKGDTLSILESRGQVVLVCVWCVFVLWDAASGSHDSPFSS